MKIRGLIAEDFVNYKKPSMFIITAYCDWKCCHEGGFSEEVCQNYAISKGVVRDIDIDAIIESYLSNPISRAVVIGGLEPFLQFDEILEFVDKFRKVCNEDIVIYTGYTYDEIYNQVNDLRAYKNIIIKFGRYKQNNKPHRDAVLGVDLISDNQYAEKIS